MHLQDKKIYDAIMLQWVERFLRTITEPQFLLYTIRLCLWDATVASSANSHNKKLTKWMLGHEKIQSKPKIIYLSKTKEMIWKAYRQENMCTVTICCKIRNMTHQQKWTDYQEGNLVIHTFRSQNEELRNSDTYTYLWIYNSMVPIILFAW